MLRVRGFAFTACAGALMFALSGCADTTGSTRDAQGSKAQTKPPAEAPPTYSAAAAAYNKRIEGLQRFRAAVNVQFRYKDERGELKTEQPDGQLQVVRPDRLAVSLGKAGKVLFWFGCDAERYWWLDMTGDGVARVGRHARLDAQRLERLGLSVGPRDLIEALGITPMDAGSAGATQWSRDGRLLGITCPLSHGGSRRVWVRPSDYRPSLIELFDREKKVVLVAELSGDERVDVSGPTSGGRPWIPGTVMVYPQDAEARVRITLTDAKDRQVSDKAFMLDELLKTYGIQRIDDLDAADGAGVGGHKGGGAAGAGER